MARWTPALVAVVASSFLLAGCAGPKGAAPTPTAADDPYALPEGAHNMVLGRVVAVDESPIFNATIEVLGTGVNTTTDDAGEYRILNLEPRDYNVAASKDGYRTKTQRAIILDGQILQMDFRLEEKPLIKPYNTTLSFNGMISCQFSYGTNPENVEYVECGTVDGNNKPSHDFDIPAGAAQVQIEADWTPRTDLSRNLTMMVDSIGFGHQDLVFGRQTGTPGLKIPVSESMMRKYYPQGGQMRVQLYAAPNIGGDDDHVQAGLSLQQDFKVYFTIFFVEPGPPTFSYLKS